MITVKIAPVPYWVLLVLSSSSSFTFSCSDKRMYLIYKYACAASRYSDATIDRITNHVHIFISTLITSWAIVPSGTNTDTKANVNKTTWATAQLYSLLKACVFSNFSKSNQSGQIESNAFSNFFICNHK